MTKHIRRKVLRYETRPNDGPSMDLFPLCYTAVLECGHRLNQGVDDTRNKWKACFECTAEARRR